MQSSPPLRPRKQRVSLAHKPIGNEADPLLRSHVEAVQGRGARNESSEWMRFEVYRIRLHLKSSSSKASDSPRHMQGRSDQQPPFAGRWFEQRGGVKCVLGSRPRSGLHVNARRVAAEEAKYLEPVTVGRVGRPKPAEDE